MVYSEKTHKLFDLVHRVSPSNEILLPPNILTILKAKPKNNKKSCHLTI